MGQGGWGLPCRSRHIAEMESTSGEESRVLCYASLGYSAPLYGDLVRAFSGSQKGGLIGEVASLALCLAHKIFQKLL